MKETTINIKGEGFRVWEDGVGPKVGFLAGFGGLLQWPLFLKTLSKTNSFIVPSLPGFPGGGGRSHLSLDSELDWLLLVRDLLDGCNLTGEDIIGVSLGGALAADVTAVWPDKAKRLVLVSPLGICNGNQPIIDPWGVTAQDQPRLLCNSPKVIEEHQKIPEGQDELEWEVSQIRANEAAARLLWPNGDTGLQKRISRIGCDTLIIWGADDKIIPNEHRSLYSNGLSGRVEECILAGAGHQADFDKPVELAEIITSFLENGQ